jgi:DNA-binding response OmpR family regulator
MQLALDHQLPFSSLARVQSRTRLQSHKEHVLLIERDAFWADLASKSLTTHGYRVTHMASETQALEALLAPAWAGRTCLAEVMLLDCDATEARSFLQVLRESKAALPPIVLVGTLSIFDLMVAVAETGAADYVQKPYSGSDLLSAVRHSLGRGRVRHLS